uniref:LisH domain-containing protein n=1 Tax=Anopheles atroparvus TaxID=41427 RepID=A0A182JK82_ANOAO
MPDSSRTLGDIEDIDSAELKIQLKKWIEEEGIETNIQLQMKRNLIEKMSRTTLGKKIAIKLQTQQGIVLSPLVLVLNTLVAEFLYTQNCHFSLSIFTNEVPFKNTLPDFTRSPKFRLNRTELGEIFEALGIKHHEGLVEKYEKFGTEQGSSLLYIVFKSILTSVQVQERKLRQLRQRADSRATNARTLVKQLEVKKLQRNVEKLLHRLKTVGKAIAHLDASQQQLQQNPPAGASVSVAHNQESQEEAPSLRMCSENVSRLVERLESCTKMFEQLVEALQQQRNEDGRTRKATANHENDGDASETNRPQREKKTYTEFLHELKSTDHGKKYVAKLQKQVSKLLAKEKSQMEAKYDKRVQQLEQEYKEKMGTPILCPTVAEPAVLPDSRRHRSPPTEMHAREVESQHFMRKIDEKLDELYKQERNVDSKLAILRSDLQRQEQRQSSYFESLKAAKTKESKLQVLHSVERELMATFEDETNAIIQNAKQTIEQLERESDKINHSFQRYLQKQREDKRKLIDEKVQIWTRYNDEKLELNQKELLYSVPDEANIEQQGPIPAPNAMPQVTVPIRLADDGARFENPFRSFDPLKYLRHARPIEKYMVDVAIATSSDIAQQTSPDDSPAVEVNVINERTDGQLLKVPLPQPTTTTASLSDLSLSSVASKLSYEKSQSLDGELDRISTGARSDVSENSWT